GDGGDALGAERDAPDALERAAADGRVDPVDSDVLIARGSEDRDPAGAAVRDRVRDETVDLGVERVGRVEVALDRHVHEVDVVRRAGADEPGEDPARESAEAGGQHLVRGDPYAGRDAVGSETVRGAGDPARNPGAVTLEVAVAAIAQAGAVDVAETEELAQVVARDEVAAQV